MFNVDVVGQRQGTIIVRWRAGLVRAAQVGSTWMIIAAAIGLLFIPIELLHMVMTVAFVSPFGILADVIAKAVNEPLDTLPEFEEDE